ncbi:hypothetical protein Vretimale_4320 [Volvox reticuliferus]|uniref:Centrosomal protein POC5 n=1 Tax=Volvox reticuliferus TaxID=1737510 RepID=A0A8J4C1H0_9CHLO|nr:hypothetical protein Vretifemale_2964 [Volvox reticuliferus]GIL99103.1 hypothetical protein Vretimale_4320 [Volvox reticuliferus]
MSASTNPYLVGYEQFLRKPNSEYNQTDPQPSSVQPTHPMLITSVSARTPAVVSRTNAPATEPVQPTAHLQPSTNLDDSSGIDIFVPMPPGGLSTQLPPSDVLNFPGATTRPQTPTTLNIIARPSGVTAGQAEPAAVEITISTQHEEPQPYVSHLQGLTVQQMLDLDIDALVVKIDEHHNQAKKAVLDHVMETKARLMQAKNDAVEEEKRKGATLLATKEEEINLMTVEMENMRLKGERLWDVLGRCCAAYGNAKERRRVNLVQFQVFCAWRRQAMMLARRRRLLARAERWDINVHLKRNVFRAWFRETMRAHRVTLNNRYIQEVDNAKRLIHEHYQRQIAEMERMLADAGQQLEREAETRARLEEDMKRAFMRGVCALNIEAMNMMKRGAAAGGANPANGGAPLAAEKQPTEPAAGASVATNAPAFASHASAAPAASEMVNPDLRGSITLSPPPFTAQSGPGGAGSSTCLGPSSSAQPLAATSASAVRLSGNGITSTAPTVTTMLTGSSSSRPGSSYGPPVTGSAVTVSGNSLLLGRPGAGLQQAAVATTGQGPSTSGGGLEGGPTVWETAQTFYQRPQVVVTRGPGLTLAASSTEVPRPRTNAPLPTVRML